MVMRMNTKNDEHVGQCSTEQSSHEQSAKSGNHTKESQHGTAPVPPSIRITRETGNKCNKWIRWSNEEIKEVIWSFHVGKSNNINGKL
jgi:hypothetical protein